MRHRKHTVKLGRTSAHREAMLANLVSSLILERRVTTTLAKAKTARSMAERMVTLGKKGDLAARRRAVSKLHQKKAVQVLFGEIAPQYTDRAGGYTRIVKLGRRGSDSSEMALLEWVEKAAPAASAPEGEAKPAKKAAAKKKAASKKAPAKKTASKKAPAKKTASKKAPAKKSESKAEEAAPEEG